MIRSSCHPVEVREVYTGPYKAWYPTYPDTQSHSAAKELIREIVEDEGPFDAVMAFSQGAALISTLMLEHRRSNPFAAPWFRLAIFICGGCPLVVKDNSWHRMDITRLSPHERINIPTVHITGR